MRQKESWLSIQIQYKKYSSYYFLTNNYHSLVFEYCRTLLTKSLLPGFSSAASDVSREHNREIKEGVHRE
jgi:hypothetical protein